MRTWIAALIATLALARGGRARADLMLTAAGQAQGLGLSTFATGFPNTGGNGAGPLGIAFTTGGGVLVSDVAGNVRRFATDADGQNAASAPVGQNYGSYNADGLAQTGGHVYLANGNSSRVIQLNDDGSFNQVLVSGPSPAIALVTNPSNGHLFVSNADGNQVFDIDPVAKTSTFFHSVARPDGLSISPDGKTLYAAATGTGHVLGFNIATGAQVFDSGVILGGIDGTAAGAGLFSNDLFANVNNGTLVEINLTTLVQTVIAMNGSRGDFVTVDPTNDTLLITQTDRIIRLSGASFVPEPSSVALMSTGAIGLLALSRRRLRRAAA